MSFAGRRGASRIAAEESRVTAAVAAGGGAGAVAGLGTGKNDEVPERSAGKSEEAGTEAVTAGAKGADAEGRVLTACSGMAADDAPGKSVEEAE